MSQARRKHRRRSRRRQAEPAADRIEDARRRADRKARALQELLHYALVVGALALFLPPVAWIVGIFWGMDVGRKLVKHFIEPELRQRWIDKEVRRELARTVDAERQELAGQHSRHIEELAAGVAHEIRNPITAARSLVQQMGEDPGSKENVAYANVALEELQRVEKSISHLLRFAREEDMVFEELLVSDVVASALEALREPIAHNRVELVTEIDGPAALRGDAEKLRRVVINLVANALDAVAGQHTPAPRVEVAAGSDLAGREVWVRVRDNGPGMPAESLAHIWSPFYTSKDEGTGLGLAISKKLVDGHGGRISAHSEPGQGTEFLVTLPREGHLATAEEREETP